MLLPYNHVFRETDSLEKYFKNHFIVQNIEWFHVWKSMKFFIMQPMLCII